MAKKNLNEEGKCILFFLARAFGELLQVIETFPIVHEIRLSLIKDCKEEYLSL